MQYLISLMALTACVVVINAQPRNDIRFNDIPYFVEQINPTLNRHRGRFRPFAGQKGAPIANIRAGRSINEEINTDVECVYAFESFFCKGMDKTGVETQVECDAQENFDNLGLSNIEQYALSDLRILKTENSDMYKMYMFGKNLETSTWMSYIVKDTVTMNRNVLSVHNAADNLNDQGIKILNSECWERVVEFMKSMKDAKTVDIMKNDRPVKIIANLSVY